MRAYIPVWFTRPLSGEEVRLARSNGIEPIVHPLISIQFEPVSAILERTSQLPEADALLFTSRNAVDAFLACRVMRSEWLKEKTVYAVGERTALRLSEAGFDPQYPSERQDGTAVAKMISSDMPDGGVLWHFCAKDKRPEAKEILKETGVEYHSITTYSTILLGNAGIPEEPFDAIVFYSPSAVKAFIQNGITLDADIMVVSIGNTTAQALKDAGIEKVTVAPKPSTASLVEVIHQLQF